MVRAADPAAEAAKSYRIDTQGSTVEVNAGGKGTLVLAIVPVEKVHVHPQAPLKITLEAPGLTLEKTSLGHIAPVLKRTSGMARLRRKVWASTFLQLKALRPAGFPAGRKSILTMLSCSARAGRC
jgi:hypothetical protein